VVPRDPQNTTPDDVRTQTLTEFYSPESPRRPTGIAAASFQQSRPEEESKQNYSQKTSFEEAVIFKKDSSETGWVKCV